MLVQTFLPHEIKALIRTAFYGTKAFGAGLSPSKSPCAGMSVEAPNVSPENPPHG